MCSSDLAAADREAVPAPHRDRRDSAEPSGADDAPAGERRGRDGAAESQRPDALGGPDEHLQSTGRGDSDGGAYSQLSFFLSEAEQIRIIDEAENVKTSSAFSFTQEQPRPEAADQEAEAAKPTLRELHEKYKPIVLEAVSQDIRYEDDLRVKSARLVELDTLLNLDGRGRSQPESVIAKSARP